MRPGPLLPIALALTACSGGSDATWKPLDPPLRMVEVVRINGHSVSLSQFDELRVRFPGVSKEDRVWLVSAAGAICTRREEMGRWLDPRDSEPDCLRLALYARGLLPHTELDPLVARLSKRLGTRPGAEQLRLLVEGVLSRSKLEKNAELLSQIQ